MNVDTDIIDIEGNPIKIKVPKPEYV